jgi:hypothetical protein
MRPTALLTIVTTLVATASPALAETVHCTDAKGEVVVEYDLAESGSLVTRVQMEMTDDFGISTDPAHQDHSGETITEQSVTGDSVDVTLRVNGGSPALRLRLVVVTHGVYWLNAGALSVEGGGVWAVTCDK